jgi:hypothetical protein
MSAPRLVVMLIACATAIAVLGFALAATDYFDVTYLLASGEPTGGRAPE